MAEYHFSTVWRVEASIQEVWIFFIPISGRNGGKSGTHR